MPDPLALAAALAVLAAPSGASPAYPGPRPQDQAKEFLFVADLGPAEIDVSSYPAAQKRRYALVAERCAACHTLARTVNSRLVTKAQWTPYVDRMHWVGSGAWDAAARKEASEMLRFLAYDSRRRKVAQRARFEADAAVLEKRFAEYRRSRGWPSEAAP
ncbi:MAG: hypothetical protein HY079_02540 [Elusimicrobia bacterium]|nr:hypothetical protein [Elusimicrobiota bacterium]